MTRRTFVLVASIITLICGALFSALPAAASHPGDVDPTKIDPAALQLPASVLPPGTAIDHSAVSDNPDADGNTTPTDGHKSVMGPPVHHSFYEQLGRISGYRTDMRYTISGAEIGTEYLASIFPDTAHATAAMNDVVGPGSLISFIGQPLDPCHAGTACKAYYGPNPLNPGYNAVFAVFTEGPILVETGSQVPSDKFEAMKPAMESTLFALLSAADSQVQTILFGSSGPAPTATASATATTTPTSTPQPKPAPTKKPVKKCKKGYKLVKGKCKKKK